MVYGFSPLGGKDLEKLTPLMKQYNNVKNQYQDSILFFRMGDFFETFNDDAKTVARELNIVLTSREKNKGKRIPLAGVPHHAADTYIARLIKKGYKVAICDQVEDPKFAKGLVKREVTRVITPGTLLEDSLLSDKDNNYLVSIVLDKPAGKYGLSYADISTGEFYATEGSFTDTGAKLNSELTRLKPSECIISESMFENKEDYPEFFQFIENLNIALSPIKDEFYNYELSQETLLEHFQLLTLEGLGSEDKPFATTAAGVVLNYLQDTQKTKLKYINNLNIYSLSDFMILDATTLRNLELARNIRDNTKKGTLIEVLDKTVTAMGSRLLRKNLVQPLLQLDQINERLDAVEEFTDNIFLRQDLREHLRNIYDLERLISRVVYGSANARDLLALKQSFLIIPEIKKLIHSAEPGVKSHILRNLENDLPNLTSLAKKIEDAIVPDPPATIKDGGLIKHSYSQKLDELKDGTKGAKKWISSLEAKERRRTGINNLRVGFNKVFGYYIEIRKTQINKVPEDYIRKQTLVNAERYITEELKEKESLILSADEKIKALEYKLFIELRDFIAQDVKDIQLAAQVLASLDMLTALSEVAINNGYNRPEIVDNDEIKIVGGRHPVVENMLATGFVANDTLLNCGDNQLIILTGPNMAGKSTYMRQIAHITILAQIGSFVPATKAKIGIVDRIFTRVGAFDDLTRGQSTFMVEMVELANILNTSTNKSLILLDEIGRGTSTFDGLSIAWAVSEYLYTNSQRGAKTIFATHYHHLNELAEIFPGVKNFNISVKEEKDNIIFLYKVKTGGTNRSYGIQVARLAGLPQQVIDRAKTILTRIESENLIGLNNKLPKMSNVSKTSKKGKKVQDLVSEDTGHEPSQDALSAMMVNNENQKDMNINDLSKADTKLRQLRFFTDSTEPSPILNELKELDIKNITPIQALNKLYELQKKANGNGTNKNDGFDNDLDD
jgi:DNA mismatch repair protein MutS